MPITSSAIKKLRVDKRKTLRNKQIKTQALKAIKDFRGKPEEKKLAKVFSSIDKAAKKRIFHPKKADRLKSRLNKLVGKKKTTKKKTVASKKK